MARVPVAAVSLASFAAGIGTALLLSMLEGFVIAGAVLLVLGSATAVFCARRGLGANPVRGWLLTVHIHVLGSVLFGVAAAAALIMIVNWDDLHWAAVIGLLAVVVGVGGLAYMAVTFTGVFHAGHRALAVRDLADGDGAVEATVKTVDDGFRLGLSVCAVEFQDAQGEHRRAMLLSRGERVLPGAWVLYSPDDRAQPIRLYDSLRERP